jgi:hypothetical protein
MITVWVVPPFWLTLKLREALTLVPGDLYSIMYFFVNTGPLVLLFTTWDPVNSVAGPGPNAWK